MGFSARKTLRIGFIGSGFIAHFHLRSLVGVRNVEVTGVYSPTPSTSRCVGLIGALDTVVVVHRHALSTSRCARAPAFLPAVRGGGAAGGARAAAPLSAHGGVRLWAAPAHEQLCRAHVR